MTKNCLVTKLKVSVQNNNLHFMNGLRFFCKENAAANIETNTLHIITNSEIKIKSVGGVACMQVLSVGASVLPDSGYLAEVTINGEVLIAIKNIDCEFYIDNKYAINSLSRDYSSDFNIGLSYPDELKYVTTSRIFLPNLKGSGTVEFLNNESNSYIMMSGSTLAINIDNVISRVLTSLNVGYTPSFGNIATFVTNCPIATYLEIIGTNVNGTLESVLEVLKATNRYSFTLIPNVLITAKGRPIGVTVYRLTSNDNGVTYTVYDSNNKIQFGIYNTNTKTWDA